jgi:hypothetical protein
VVAANTIRQILTDIFDFRQSREQRFGMPLETVAKDRDTRAEELRRSLQPLRMSLAGASYLSGDTAAWADYVTFGQFQWHAASAVSNLSNLMILSILGCPA